MDKQPSRRQYLAALGVTSIAGIAGCSQINIQQPATEAPTRDLGGANFSFEYDAQAQAVTIQYNGGATIQAGNLQIRSSSGMQIDWSQLGSTTTGSDSQLTSGSTAVLGADILNWGQAVGPGETIRLVFAAGDGPSTLGRFTPPESSTLTSTQTSTNGIVAEEQLISRWPLEEDLGDVVGDNDATADIGEAEFGSYAGRAAVRFDGDLGVMVNEGENEELSLMDSENSGSSFGGWVYFDAEAGGNPNGDNTRHHILRNDNEYNFTAVPSDDLESFQFRFGSDGYNTSDVSEGELTVSSEEWHHFFYVIVPESSVRFYLDGELLFEDTDMDASASTETAYWSHETIGSWYGTGDPTWYDLFVGKMADLRIYESDLSDDDVAQIYQNGGGSDSDSNSESSNSYTAQNGLAYQDNHVYVVSDGEIHQVELSTNEAVTSFAAPSNSRPTGLAYGDGSLWFADGIDSDYDGEIVELDPATGDVQSRLSSSWDPRGLAFGDGSLWAVDITSNRIVELSTDGDELSSFDTRDVTWGQGLAYADGSLWLGNNCSGSDCNVSLREYDTDGTLVQQVGERSSDSTAPYGGLAATDSELLGPDTDGTVTTLRTL
jgi:hypothetical protein